MASLLKTWIRLSGRYAVVPPGDVGRCRWTLTDGSPQIVALAPDPCTGRRYELAESATFIKAKSDG